VEQNDRARIGRIGGYTRSALHDSREMTALARQASRDNLDARLLAKVDPDGAFPPDERRRRLTAARSAYFAGLAHKSHAARAKVEKFERIAAEADAELAAHGGEG